MNMDHEEVFHREKIMFGDLLKLDAPIRLYEEIKDRKNNFGSEQFKEFMKELMFTSGIDGKPICFLMTDTQIISESFIEDINNLLNTGEILCKLRQSTQPSLTESVTTYTSVCACLPSVTP